ncbi:MAG TPA: hypothetical protein VKA86_17900 [Candidatus Krumholzibacteria bacterium]|nr:hypothetical protein [Candidatus Krumholzibacteria bacterium]
MSTRDLIPALCALLLLPLVGCGDDDDPTGPSAAAGDIELSVTELDYGTVFENSSDERSFTIEAAADNEGDVSGSIALAEGSSGDFSVTMGGGDFTLAPGESRSVGVTYSSPGAGRVSSGAVEFDVGGVTLPLRGFSSAPAYFEVDPDGVSGAVTRTNYAPFADGGVTISYGTGRSHGASPDWIRCGSTAKWIFNGNGISESKVDFTFPLPSSVTGIGVSMLREAESDCTQMLVEVDGEEFRYENQTGCDTWSDTYGVAGGGHTVGIGTDQQGFCGGDLHVRSITFSFQGFLVPESQWN